MGYYKTDLKDMEDWLRLQGAEVLSPTNPYEVVRFRARGGVHIVYQNGAGVIKASGFAWECVQAFKKKHGVWMGSTQKTRSSFAKKKAALRNRDGDICFYCLLPMQEEEMTVEHLIPRQIGGPDHIDNLVLAHEKCNMAAGKKPLKEKIEVHVQARMLQVDESTL